MQPTSPSTSTDYLFLDLFDRYVRRVADQCDLPEITDQRTLLNKVDVSPLSPDDQKTFEDWLSQRFYLRISIENALRRGLLVSVALTEPMGSHQVDYSVRIESR